MFRDGLSDRASILSVAITTDSSGGQIKTPTMLYQDIPCRVSRGQIRPRLYPQEGSIEVLSEPWILVCEPQYSGANRGDRIIWQGNTYIIVLAHKITGEDGTGTHHMTYTMDERV